MIRKADEYNQCGSVFNLLVVVKCFHFIISLARATVGSVALVALDQLSGGGRSHIGRQASRSILMYFVLLMFGFLL